MYQTDEPAATDYFAAAGLHAIRRIIGLPVEIARRSRELSAARMICRSSAKPL
jgi:hypothetical protein